MHKLIYSMSASLDGFIAGHGGEIDWAAPGGELMRFHNEQTKEISAHLCGRGLCAGMLPWETEGTPVGSPGAGVRPALGGHPKVVFSRTLQQVAGNARLVDAFQKAGLDVSTASPAADLALGKTATASFTTTGTCSVGNTR